MRVTGSGAFEQHLNRADTGEKKEHKNGVTGEGFNGCELAALFMSAFRFCFRVKNKLTPRRREPRRLRLAKNETR